MFLLRHNLFQFYFYSGYGSAAVSTSNLLSEDSLSIRSISVDDSPETEGKSYLSEESALGLNKIKMENVGSVNSCVGQPSQGISHRTTETGTKSGQIVESVTESTKYLSINDRGDGGSSKSVSGDESANEGSPVVSTKLPPGKVSFRSFFLHYFFFVDAAVLHSISFFRSLRERKPQIR